MTSGFFGQISIPSRHVIIIIYIINTFVNSLECFEIAKNSDLICIMGFFAGNSHPEKPKDAALQ